MQCGLRPTDHPAPLDPAQEGKLGLDFLGLGAQSPTISWGAMLADGQTFLATAPWVAVFPGVALLLAVLGVNLLGDGLRDLLDPRFRE